MYSLKPGLHTNLDSQTLRRAYLPGLQILHTVCEPWLMNYAYSI